MRWNLLHSVILVAAIAVEARAEERAINAAGSIDGGLLTVHAVGPMPKGLFSIGNKLVRTKSSLKVHYIIDQAECGLPAVVGVIDAGTTGTFLPYLNPQGQTVAYGWQATLDLTAQQNHWHNFIQCNGTSIVVGCQASRSLTLNFVLSTPGGEEWGAEQITGLSLASVQDPDEYEQNCCDEAVQTAGRRDCHHACVDAFHACKDACPVANCGSAPKQKDFEVCTGTGRDRRCTYPGYAEAEAAYLACQNNSAANYGACVSVCAQNNGDCHQACNDAWPSCAP